MDAKQKQFLHRLLEPYQALVQRCAQNDLVAAEINDVIASACELAVSAAHFLESQGLPAQTGAGEDIRLKLADVADTYKHGALRNPERIVTFDTIFAWEFNDQDECRFLRVEILVRNERFGSLDLVPTIGAYLQHLNSSLGLGFGSIEPNIPAKPFTAEAVLEVTRRTVVVPKARIRTYKRNANGELVLTDVNLVRFVVR